MYRLNRRTRTHIHKLVLASFVLATALPPQAAYAGDGGWLKSATAACILLISSLAPISAQDKKPLDPPDAPKAVDVKKADEAAKEAKKKVTPEEIKDLKEKIIEEATAITAKQVRDAVKVTPMDSHVSTIIKNATSTERYGYVALAITLTILAVRLGKWQYQRDSIKLLLRQKKILDSPEGKAAIAPILEELKTAHKAVIEAYAHENEEVRALLKTNLDKFNGQVRVDLEAILGKERPKVEDGAERPSVDAAVAKYDAIYARLVEATNKVVDKLQDQGITELEKLKTNEAIEGDLDARLKPLFGIAKSSQAAKDFGDFLDKLEKSINKELGRTTGTYGYARTFFRAAVVLLLVNGAVQGILHARDVAKANKDAATAKAAAEEAIKDRITAIKGALVIEDAHKMAWLFEYHWQREPRLAALGDPPIRASRNAEAENPDALYVQWVMLKAQYELVKEDGEAGRMPFGPGYSERLYAKVVDIFFAGSDAFSRTEPDFQKEIKKDFATRMERFFRLPPPPAGGLDGVIPPGPANPGRGFGFGGKD